MPLLICSATQGDSIKNIGRNKYQRYAQEVYVIKTLDITVFMPDLEIPCADEKPDQNPGLLTN